MFVLVLAFQSAAAAAPKEPAPVAFDLPRHRSAAAACAEQGAADIVVCGRRIGDGYRVPDLGRQYEERPLVAETGIAPNASVRAYTESVQMPDGQISKRAMVGVKLRF